MINPVAAPIRPQVPAAMAGQGDVGMTIGRPTINSNIAARLAPQLNHAPAMAGAGAERHRW